MPHSPSLPFACCAFVLLAACQATAPKTAIVSVATTPPGAVLTIVDVGECETPCTVEVDRETPAVIAKAGFDPVTVALRPDQRKLAITLKLAAPTKAVDEVALPEIE